MVVSDKHLPSTALQATEMQLSDDQVFQLLNAMRYEQHQMMLKFQSVEDLVNGQQERINHLEIKSDMFEELASKVDCLKDAIENQTAKQAENSSNDDAIENNISFNQQQLSNMFSRVEDFLKVQQERMDMFDLRLAIFEEISKNGLNADNFVKEMTSLRRKVDETHAHSKILLDTNTNNIVSNQQLSFSRVEDLLKVQQERITRFENKLEEFANKDKMKADNCVKEMTSLGRKVDEAVTSMVKIQNAVQKSHEGVTKRDATKTQPVPVTEIESVPVGQYGWMKSRISINNGIVQTTSGNTFSLETWRKAIEMEVPWTLFPEEYEVECYNCKKQIPVSFYLQKDKGSVRCPYCHRETVLGPPKPGFEWVLCYPCSHFQQAQIGESPKNCLFCGKVASCTSNLIDSLD